VVLTGKVISLPLMIALPVLVNLGGTPGVRAQTEAEVRKKADELAHEILLLDTHLEDVSAYPNLIHELLKRGYHEQDIRKIGGDNFLHAWAVVERVAAALRP
jgi:hypothetical protein